MSSSVPVHAQEGTSNDVKLRRPINCDFVQLMSSRLSISDKHERVLQ